MGRETRTPPLPQTTMNSDHSSGTSMSVSDFLAGTFPSFSSIDNPTDDILVFKSEVNLSDELVKSLISSIYKEISWIFQFKIILFFDNDARMELLLLDGQPHIRTTQPQAHGTLYRNYSKCLMDIIESNIDENNIEDLKNIFTTPFIIESFENEQSSASYDLTMTPFAMCVQHGQLEVIKTIRQLIPLSFTQPILIKKFTDDHTIEESAVTLAIKYEQRESLTYFLSNGEIPKYLTHPALESKLTSDNSISMLPFWSALRYQHLSMYEILLKQWQVRNSLSLLFLYQKTRNLIVHLTHLGFATLYGKPVMDLLLSDKQTKEILLADAKTYSSIPTDKNGIVALFEYPENRKIRYYNALHWAAQRDDIELLKLFLDHKLDPFVCTIFETYAIKQSSRNTRLNVLAFTMLHKPELFKSLLAILKEKEVDENKFNQPAFIEKIIPTFYPGIDHEAYYQIMFSPLMLAIFLDNKEQIETLLGIASVVNQLSQPVIVKTPFESEWNIDSRTGKRSPNPAQTHCFIPLAFAMKRGAKNAIKVLLEHSIRDNLRSLNSTLISNCLIFLKDKNAEAISEALVDPMMQSTLNGNPALCSALIQYAIVVDNIEGLHQLLQLPALQQVVSHRITINTNSSSQVIPHHYSAFSLAAILENINMCSLLLPHVSDKELASYVTHPASSFDKIKCIEAIRVCSPHTNFFEKFKKTIITSILYPDLDAIRARIKEDFILFATQLYIDGDNAVKSEHALLEISRKNLLLCIGLSDSIDDKDLIEYSNEELPVQAPTSKQSIKELIATSRHNSSPIHSPTAERGEVFEGEQKLSTLNLT